MIQKEMEPSFLRKCRLHQACGVKQLLWVSGLFLCTLFLSAADFRDFQGEDLLVREAVNYRAEGIRFQQRGQLEKALTSYQKAIQLSPKYADAYNDLGVILETLGELEKAQETYQKALEINPKLSAAHVNLAFLYERLGKIEEAAPHWTARVRGGTLADPWVVKSRDKLIQYRLPVPEIPEGVEPALKGNRGFQEHRGTIKKEEKLSAAPLARPAAPEKKVSPEERQVQEARAVAKEIEKAKQKAKVATPLPGPAAREQASERMAKEMVAKKMAQEARQSGATIPVEPLQGQTVESVPLPPVSRGSEQTLSLDRALVQEKGKAQQETIQEIYQRGIAHMRLGLYEQAEADFKQILALDPNHVLAKQALKRAQVALEKSSRTVKTIP